MEFLKTNSDFGFEVSVCKNLHSLGFHVEHGGTYTDPVTNKLRQFDIRANRSQHKFLIGLAVECKNLKPHFPLLVSCLPRTKTESFHEVALSVDRKRLNLKTGEATTQYHLPYTMPRGQPLRFDSASSLYKHSTPVGKCCEQVGKDINDNFTSTDSDAYEKWSQAIASAHDLVMSAYEVASEDTAKCLFAFVMPILVVPDGTLWQADFDADGNSQGKPHLVNRCSLYLDKSYVYRDSGTYVEHRISHLEFVTATGLEALIKTLTEADWEYVFNPHMWSDFVK